MGTNVAQYPTISNMTTTQRTGRPGGLNDPEIVKLAAAMYVEGVSREDMAKQLGISKWTVSQWRKDPRVRAQVTKLVEDRVMRIVGKTDHIIEGRLQNAQEMDTELLLRIRKEFLGGAFRALHEGGKADEDTIYEALGEVEADPDLVAGLHALLSRRQEAKGNA